MPVTSSLTNRIFFACTLLAMLSLGFAFYFVNARATSEAEAELRRGLNEAGILVDQNRVALTDTFTRLARLVADGAPKLKAAVETGDPPTVQPLADEYRDQMNADLLLLTGRRGELLASAGSGRRDLALPSMLGDTGSLDEVSTFIAASARRAPGRQRPDRSGRKSTGCARPAHRRLPAGRSLRRNNQAPDGERDCVRRQRPYPRLHAAGRLAGSARARDDRVRHFASSRSAMKSSWRSRVHSCRPISAPRRGIVPVALTLRSRTERLRFLNTIRTGLEGALIITLLLATIVSYAVSRTMTRPLSAITSAMRDVAATGDLTRKVPLRSGPWDDADARLLAAAFNTLTESIARFQAEAAQTRAAVVARTSVHRHRPRDPQSADDHQSGAPQPASATRCGRRSSARRSRTSTRRRRASTES